MPKDAGLFPRFLTSALRSTGNLLEGVGSLAGPNIVGMSFGALRDMLPEYTPAEGFGERAAEFVGGAVPDLALGISTAPAAFGTRAALEAKGLSKLASIAGGEAAQSAAILPFDLARKDRTTGQALAGAGIGAAAGTALTSIFGRLFAKKAAETVDTAIREAPAAAAGGKDKVIRVGNEVKPIAEPEVQLPLPFDEAVKPRPATAIRDFPANDAARRVQDLFSEDDALSPLTNPERMQAILRRRNPAVRQKLLETATAARVAGETALSQIERAFGPDSLAGKFVRTAFEDNPTIEARFVRGSDWAARYLQASNKVLLNYGQMAVDNVEKAARLARHELGHFLTFRAGAIVPDRARQIGFERQAMHAVKALKVIEGAVDVRAAVRSLSDLSKLVPDVSETSVFHGLAAKMLNAKGTKDEVLMEARLEAHRWIMDYFEQSEQFRFNADAFVQGAGDLVRGADEFLIGVSETARHNPFRPSNLFPANEQGSFLQDALRLGERVPSRVQWGTDEGIADAVEFIGRTRTEQREGGSLIGRETMGRLLGTESAIENQFIAEALSGSEHAARYLDRSGRGGLLVDAMDPASSVRHALEIGGQEAARAARVRLLLEPSAPAMLRDGTIVQPGSPEFAQMRAQQLARWAMTQDEYAAHLREGMEKVGGLTAKNIAKAQRKEPFRMFPFQDQFQYDTLARRSLKAQGLNKKAQDAALEAMTPGQRQALAMEWNLQDRFGPQAAAMMSDAVDGADEHIKSSLINDIADMTAKAKGRSLPGTGAKFKRIQQMTRTIELAQQYKAEAESLGRTAAAAEHAAQIKQLTRERNLLRKELAETSRAMAALNPYADSRITDIFTPPPKGEVGTLQGLFDKLVFLYKGNLLLHPATYLGNIVSTVGFGAVKPARTFAAGALDLARSTATGAERTRYMSDAAAEATAWFESTFSALPGLKRLVKARPDTGDLAAAAQTLRPAQVREGITPKNPFAGVEGEVKGLAKVSKPAEWIFRGLNAADNWMFNNAFQSQIRTAASREALRTGQSAEEVLSGWARRVLDHTKSARVQAENAATKAFNDALAAGKEAIEAPPRAVDAEAGEILRQIIKDDPQLMQLVQSQEMADRLIFTAREGRKLDQALDWMTHNNSIRNVLEPFLPFRRTTANIMREQLRLSPFGAAPAAVKFFERAAARESFEQGLKDMDPTEVAEMLATFDRESMGQLMDDLGTAAVGTAMAGATLALVAGGAVQYMPFDRGMSRTERLLREQAGQGTEAVQVGEWSVPANRVPPPIAAMLRAGQQIVNLSDDDPNKAVLAANWMGSFVANMADETFLQGLEGLVSTARDPRNAGIRFAGRLGGSVLPRFVQPSTYTDIRPATERDPATGVADAFIRGAAGKIGLGEQQVGPLGERRQRTDILGTGIRRRSGADPIAAELVDLEVFPSMGLPRDLGLPVAKQNDALQAKGQLQRQMLSQVMGNPQYYQWAPEVRKRVVERTIAATNRRANAIIKARSLRGMDISFQALLEAFRIGSPT